MDEPAVAVDQSWVPDFDRLGIADHRDLYGGRKQ